MKTHDVEQWLSRPYALRVRLLAAEEGGGWLATIPQLGESGYNGIGETEAEAIADLRELQRHLFERLAAKGEEPPAPEPEFTFAEELPSGNIALRISREMHGELKRRAQRNGLSLNSLLQELIGIGLGWHQAAEASRPVAAAPASPVTQPTAAVPDPAPPTQPPCVDADTLWSYAA